MSKLLQNASASTAMTGVILPDTAGETDVKLPSTNESSPVIGGENDFKLNIQDEAQIQLAEPAKTPPTPDIDDEYIETARAVSWADLLPPAEYDTFDADSSNIKRPIAIIRHRGAKNFKVGEFLFKNHILELYSESEVYRFSEAYNGLDPVDRNSIVSVNPAAIAASESSFKPHNVTRGALASKAIKDPKQIQ